jgi:hypothetical protein
MTPSTFITPPGRRARIRARCALASIAAALLLVGGSSGASAASDPVPFGEASGFVVLASAGATASGATTINGDFGTVAATILGGSGTVTVNGASHVGDRTAKLARGDAQDAYVNAAGQRPTTPVTAELGGQTLVPGIYSQAAPMLVTGVLTLDAQGDPNAVWVFQGGSDLTVAPGSSLSLVNGAQSCNVLWQVAGSAELGAGASFNGAIVALSSVALSTGASLAGRAFALHGMVSLDNNAITLPTCVTAGVGGLRAGDGSTVRNAERRGGLTLIAWVVAAGGVVLSTSYYLRRREGADA